MLFFKFYIEFDDMSFQEFTFIKNWIGNHVQTRQINNCKKKYYRFILLYDMYKFS